MLENNNKIGLSYRPKKRFGQNFMKDPSLREFVVNLAYLVKTDTVLEIGPGRGELTVIIALRCPVIAVEIDRDLIALLKERFSGNPRVEIVEGDILAYDFNKIAVPKFKIIGNIPYNITTPIIFKIIESRHRVTSAILTVQKEVAARLAAKPGNKDYGVLTIMAGLYASMEILKIIPAGAFTPAPNVDSAVISIKPLENPRVPVRDFELFEKLVKGAFQQRRKNIRNALLRFGIPKETVPTILAACNISENARPEDVSIEDFGRLSDLCGAGGGK